MRKNEIVPRDYGNLLDRVAALFTQARLRAIRDINLTQVMAYYEIGKEIIKFEQKGKSRGEYGEKLIERLSGDMSRKFGRGFSPTNLKMMRLFYQSFPIRQTLSDESASQVATLANFTPLLSWSHYCELLKVDEPLARSFYEKEASQNNWSVRELKRQINAMLFERLALSKDSRAVMRMAREGQMNFYLNYYRENEKQADENDPIGLILCAGKDDLFARYVLGGLTNKVFASKYKLALPSEKELRQKLGDIRS